MPTMEEAIAQAVAINKLFQQLIAVEATPEYDGDRISYQLRADFTFQTANSSSGQMTFNVPEDNDFFGERLYLYLESRRIDLSDDANSDVVFRPTRWIPTIFTVENIASMASVSYQLRDSMRGEVQSAPSSIVTAFSGELMFSSAWCGAIEFHVPYYLKRGSTFTASITPTMSTLNGGSVTREFRVTGVFDGWKPVV